MKREEISLLVDKSVNDWVSAMSSSEHLKIRITSDAVELIKHLIYYIKEDPSKIWINSDVEIGQSKAIRILPDVLSLIVNEIKSKRLNQRNITISSWEILHSISTILTTNCFFQKKKTNK